MTECQGADLSRPMFLFAELNRLHAEAEWPQSGLMRAIFLVRPGHAIGARCALTAQQLDAIGHEAEAAVLRRFPRGATP